MNPPQPGLASTLYTSRVEDQPSQSIPTFNPVVPIGWHALFDSNGYMSLMIPDSQLENGRLPAYLRYGFFSHDQLVSAQSVLSSANTIPLSMQANRQFDVPSNSTPVSVLHPGFLSAQYNIPGAPVSSVHLTSQTLGTALPQIQVHSPSSPATPVLVSHLSSTPTTSQSNRLNPISTHPNATVLLWNPWPEGTFTQMLPRDQFDQKAYVVHWAHKYKGTSRKGSKDASTLVDGKSQSWTCLGVIRCTDGNCTFVQRPKTESNARALQEQAICPVSRHGRICGCPLVRIRCFATGTFTIFASGVQFHHEGSHSGHARPPHILHLTSDEAAAASAMIENHPKVGPLGLVAGVAQLNGRSESIAAISPALMNTGRVGYEKSKLKGKGTYNDGFAFIKRLEAFQKDHPRFIIDSTNLDMQVFVMQTPFMRKQALRLAILDGPVNGHVCDAAHGFWIDKTDLLIITSAYCSTLHRWLPILFSYSNGASVGHYAYHFAAYFKGMAIAAEEANVNLTDQMLINTVDFSIVQTDAFVQGYTKWKRANNDSRSDSELQNHARSLLRGCTEHYRAGVTRVSKISGVVSPEDRGTFQNMALALMTLPTQQSFHRQVQEIRDKFPRLNSWLDWWLHPHRTRMIFEACRQMPVVDWDNAPDTTNAEEAQHRKIYSTVGKNHDFFAGLEALYSMANLYEKMHLAVLCGVPVIYGDPEPWKKLAERIGRTRKSRTEGLRKQKRSKNDGRPPDTSAQLLGTKSKKKSSHRIPLADSTTSDDDDDDHSSSDTPLAQSSNVPTRLPGSRWARNSCWLDASLELLFYASRIHLDALNHYFGANGSKAQRTGWFNLFHFIQSRIETMREDSNDLETQVLKITIGKVGLRSAIRHSQNPDAGVDMEDNSMDCLFGWIHRLASQYAKANPQDVPGCNAYFQIPYIALHSCLQGTHHIQLNSRLQQHNTLVLDATDSNLHSKWQGSIAKWFKHRLSYQKDVKCFKAGCQGACQSYWIVTGIPIVLIIELEGPYNHVWTVSQKLYPLGVGSGTNIGLVYDLVGYAEAAHNHFTATFTTGTAVYHHDGMLDSGHANMQKDLSFNKRSLAAVSKHRRIAGLVYQLQGGLEAQEYFTSERINQCSKIHHLIVSESALGGYPEVKPEGPQWKFQEQASNATYSRYESTVAPAIVLSNKKDSRSNKRSITISDSEEEEPPNKRSSRPNKRRVILSESEEEEPSKKHIGSASVKIHQSPKPLLKSSHLHQEPYILLPPPPLNWFSLPKVHSKASLTVLASKPQLPKPLSPTSPFHCRCGQEGIVQDHAQDRDLLTCSECGNSAHLACELAGLILTLNKQAQFKCRECIMNEKTYLQNIQRYEHTQLIKIKAKNKIRQYEALRVNLYKLPLFDRLYPGRSVLARYLDKDGKPGLFWYPGRLLVKHQDQSGNNTWEISWWPGCKFINADVPLSVVPERYIVDSLWHNQQARRAIRLGKWTLSGDLEDEKDDPPYYLGQEVPSNMARALSRHKIELRAMCSSDYYSQRTIKLGSCPAYDYATTSGMLNLHSLAQGDLTPLEVAQMTRWLTSNIKENPSLLMRGAAFSHAVTIVLAMKHSISLQSAWMQFQLDYKHPQLRAAARDLSRVEQIALQCLEEEMFDRRPQAGLAGNGQWGLDAGFHQDRWDPYSETPEEWSVGYIHDDPGHPEYEIYNAALTRGPNFKTDDTRYPKSDLTPQQRARLRNNRISIFDELDESEEELDSKFPAIEEIIMDPDAAAYFDEPLTPINSD